MVGAVARRPSAFCAGSLVIACVPSPSSAFVVPSIDVIVPPFNVSAFAPMLIPTVSTSVARR